MSAPERNHSPQSAAEAAEWFISLQDGGWSGEQQAAFAHWLCRSPLHVEEFLRLTALQGDLARLAEFRTLDVEGELARLQLCAAHANIVSLDGADVTGSEDNLAAVQAIPFDAWRHTPLPFAPRSRSPRERLVLFATAAVAALVAVGLSFAPIHDYLGRDHYITEVGEQRSLTLADGSQVQLNAVSNLSAQVDRTVRELQLDGGEALFRVAKDPVHPFRVRTPQAIIEAKGTRFNVHVSKHKTVVCLLEGHVLVTLSAASAGAGVARSAPEAASRSVLLNPGEEISIATEPGIPPTPRQVDVSAVVAWTQHRLVFEDAPLSEVIAEFNRYSRQPFAVHDAVLGAARITMSFDANSTHTFAESLAAVGGLHVVQQSDGTWLIERNEY